MHMFSMHTSPLAQVPQGSVPPHPSESVPQFLPAASHVVFTHVVHAWLTASQTWPTPHAGQVSGLPQPSTTSPQRPVQVPATQGEHWCVWPSQTWPCGHVPQAVRFPHLSGKSPQAAPAAAHAFVTHLLEVGSQVAFIFRSHVPHESVPAQVASGPHVAPWAVQVVGVHPAPGPVPSGVSEPRPPPSAASSPLPPLPPVPSAPFAPPSPLPRLAPPAPESPLCSVLCWLPQPAGPTPRMSTADAKTTEPSLCADITRIIPQFGNNDNSASSGIWHWPFTGAAEESDSRLGRRVRPDTCNSSVPRIRTPRYRRAGVR